MYGFGQPYRSAVDRVDSHTFSVALEAVSALLSALC